MNECRLERPDGTLWIVEHLELSGTHVRITARLRAGSAGPAGPERLEGVVLSRHDVIRWIGPEERVLWALKVPVGPVVPGGHPAGTYGPGDPQRKVS